MTTNANGNTKLLTASNSNFTKYEVAFMQNSIRLIPLFRKNNAVVCPPEKDITALCSYTSLEDDEKKDENPQC